MIAIPDGFKHENFLLLRMTSGDHFQPIASTDLRGINVSFNLASSAMNGLLFIRRFLFGLSGL